MDILSLAVSKKYTEDTAIGMGAVKGKDGEPGPQGPQGPQGEIGPKGKDGSSITITKITESSENGGENIVVFSDGKKLSVKNGKGGGGLADIGWGDIKNKPFDATVGYITISENQSITTMDLSEEIGAPLYGNFIMLETPSNKSDWISELIVVYDGTTYNLQYKYDSVMELVYFGNGSLLNIMGANIEDTGEPFGIAMIPDGDKVFIAYGLFTNDIQETAHTLSISKLGEIIKTLDPKYIADMYYDARVRSYYSQEMNPNPPQINNATMNLSGYKVSDLIPTRDEIFDNCKVIVDGEILDFKESAIILETNDFISVATSNGSYNFIFVNKSGDLNFTYEGYPMSIKVPEGSAGIYYQRPLNAGVPEGRIIEFIIGELKQIDPKFIPADLDFNLDDYYTKSEVDAALDNIDLSGYYTKNETYSKSELDEIIGDIDFVINEINKLIGE